MELIPPHKNVSRRVIDSDLPRLWEDAQAMVDLMNDFERETKRKAIAVHHSQVVTDPLDFFVLNPRYWNRSEVIVNAVIVNRVKHPSALIEGCMTFPSSPSANVYRAHKVTVRYRELQEEDGSMKLSEEIEENCSGRLAQVFQHEVDHANGRYIYL